MVGSENKAQKGLGPIALAHIAAGPVKPWLPLFLASGTPQITPYAEELSAKVSNR